MRGLSMQQEDSPTLTTTTMLGAVEERLEQLKV